MYLTLAAVAGARVSFIGFVRSLVEGPDSATRHDVVDSGTTISRLKVRPHPFKLFSIYHRGGEFRCKIPFKLFKSFSKRMLPSQFESPHWPASPEHLSSARQFLKSLSAKPDARPVLIIPDRDVDGLTSGGIMHRLVKRVLLRNRNIDVRTRFVAKGASIHDASEKAEVDVANPRCVSSTEQLIYQPCHCARSRIARFTSFSFQC